VGKGSRQNGSVSSR